MNSAPEHISKELYELGKTRFERADFVEARALLRAAIACASVLEDIEIEAKSWDLIGRIFWFELEPAAASEAIEHAADCFENLNDAPALRSARLRQAFFAYEARDFAEADAVLSALLVDPKTERESRARALGYRGNILRAQFRIDEARVAYEEALALLRPGDLYFATFQMDLGIAELLDGDMARAWEQLRAAERGLGLGKPDVLLAALVDHYLDVNATMLGIERAFEGAGASTTLTRFLAEVRSAFRESSAAAETRETVAALERGCPPSEHARLSLVLLRRAQLGDVPQRLRMLVEPSNSSLTLSSVKVSWNPESPEWRIAHALAQHRHTPGDIPSLTNAELVAIGWPGETILRKAAKNRLHVALSGLRKRGLRSVLLRSGEGYAFVSDLEVVFV